MKGSGKGGRERVQSMTNPLIGREIMAVRRMIDLDQN
jgi:hypothetical protein